MKQIYNKLIAFFVKLFTKIKSVQIEDPTPQLTKDELLQLEFTKNFGVDPNKIIKLIDKCSQNHPIGLTNRNEEILVNDLIQNAKLINKMRRYISPFHYEPDIIDIHNESISESNGPTLNNIIMGENNESTRQIKEQNKLLNNGLQQFPPSILKYLNYDYANSPKAIKKRLEDRMNKEITEQKTVEELLGLNLKPMQPMTRMLRQ